MAGKNDTLIIITPGFPENEDDTSCLPSQQLLVKAIQRNYPQVELVIVTLQYPFSDAEYTWNGIRVLSFDNKQKRKIRKAISWLQIWRQLKKLTVAHNVIGIFSFWCSECAFIGKKFGQYHTIPHYNWILGQDAREGNRYIPLINPRAEELVAISDFIAEEFERNYGVKPGHIIPNGIDTSLFGERLSVRDIDVLCAGSLIPLKQQDIFIDIVKTLASSVPGIKAVISGKGPEEKQLRKQVDELRLNDIIYFSGEQKHADLLQAMQRCKILLHPSSYEGFSTVALEALYAGAQVISFCQPMNETIPQWHIVKTKEEMTQKTLEILKEPATEYSPVCKYTMDENAKKVMSLFGY